MNLIYNLIFLLISLYCLLRVIGYAIYEIKEMKNKVGGIVVIVFSVIVVIFANVVLLMN